MHCILRSNRLLTVFTRSHIIDRTRAAPLIGALELRASSFHLRARDVLVTVVDGLELAAAMATLALGSNLIFRQSSTTVEAATILRWHWAGFKTYRRCGP